MPQSLIDAHVHFADITREPPPAWPPRDSGLYRSHTPEMLARAYVPLARVAFIAVETSRNPEDDAWLADLATHESRIAGVVLNLQPDLPGFAERLARYEAHPKFVGIRLRPIDHYDLGSQRLADSLGMLADCGKTVEFGAKSAEQKAAFAGLARTHAATTWILDHCGHPPADGRAVEGWRASISAIAERPNTVCKLTGDYLDAQRWGEVHGHLRAAFGSRRLLYGSNWPVSTACTGKTFSPQALAAFAEDDAARFFHGNAADVYGVIDAAPAV